MEVNPLCNEPAADLGARSLSVFRAVVDNYIRYGRPVSSRAVARMLGGALSPATIRNVMAGLEERALIHAPHTSAGRVPTIRGYRLYVDRFLECGSLGDPEARRIWSGLASVCDPRILLERTASLLSRLTRMAGLVSLPRCAEAAEVRQVEFVNIGGGRVLAVLVMRDDTVYNRAFTPPRALDTAELRQGADCLNELLRSMSLEEARRYVMDELRDVRRGLTILVGQALECAMQASSAGRQSDEDYIIIGEANLMNAADLCDVDTLRRLFETFRRKRDLLMLLEAAIRGQRLQVFIGNELGLESLGECSLVVGTYRVGGETAGALGVLGPTRMPYEQVIPVVDTAARMLGNVLSRRHH